MTHEIKQHTFPTPWEVPIIGFYREGTNDGGALISCMEQDEYKLETHGVGEGHVAIDIGGHIGSVSLAMASRGVRVYAVEPVPESLELFIKNIAVNNFGSLITVYPNAITSKDKDGKPIEIFYTATTSSQGIIHQFMASPVRQQEKTDYYEVGEKILVPGIFLERIFNENNIDHCRFLKIDCEGGEWTVFDGLPMDLLDSIDIISGELHVKEKGLSVSHEDLFSSMQGLFTDVSEIYEPIYCHSNLEACHFTYYNKRLIK